ncbi:phytanoyl-CoA dioxygenase family protein [Streptomyces sp. ISL-100]|uniref:phytanoyl-CoA dioxygenase family protein n=1 Tax=Streptomyces sp. ISL-100 TaxID=2819173 RepID=UPI001BEC5C3D|nr:phytanoyl-CoA dioxygenase family protein [Streptomyces sp. ISL-100]MBT2395376.1 phytanoyl-CoA dioxygenase family protein [Streptomyces sp. ISL-100]
MTTPATDPHAARAKYDADGYVVFRDVLDADLMAEAADHVAWLQERHPGLRGEDLGHTLLAKDAFWVRLVSDGRLLDIAQTFIGTDIALFASHYISKPPFSGRPVLWHQDGAFWPLEPMEVVTLWLAVDESTPENGCLRVVPGSHRQALHEIREVTDVDSVLGSESAVKVDESQAVDLVLRPGDVEVHHPNILHGSNANLSPRRRCGLTIRYIPTSTRILTDEPPFASALHLRGDAGVSAYQPRPVYVEGESFPFSGQQDWA